MKPQIIAHCLIKNEEKFIWYCLNSVLPFVDQIMVWDTGSSDDTALIIKSIKSEKIKFQQKNNVDAQGFTALRQQMLEETPSDFNWLMILDGDEIWPEESIKKVTNFIASHPNYESIVVRTHNLVGDIYHRLPESAGNYRFVKNTGHLALRFINLEIPGLKIDQPYGHEGYFDQENKPIQGRDPQKMKLFNLYYHHATGLTRSSKDKEVMQRSQKKKYELGEKISKDQIPEVFFKTHSNLIPDVTKPMSAATYLNCLIFTPLRRLKRKICH